MVTYKLAQGITLASCQELSIQCITTGREEGNDVDRRYQLHTTWVEHGREERERDRQTQD